MPTLSWDLRSPAPLEPTWDVFSDTERLLAAAGVAHAYYDEALPDGGVRRIGRAHVGNKRLEWEEPPFQFVRPQWLRSERNFRAGPTKQLVLLVRLKPRGDGGTDVRFSVEITPRSALHRPAVELGLARQVRANMGRALPMLMERLEQPELAFGPMCEVLDEEQTERIRSACAPLSERAFAEGLEQLLLTGSNADLVHIAPYALARKLGLDPDGCVHGCVEAVEAGILAMQWELLCPFCRGTRAAPDDLRRVHCPACNIFFDGTFPDALELSFRPVESLRQVAAAPSCPGSPVWRPHTMLQECLQPGVELRREVELEPGICRVRAWPMRGAASLDVRPGGPDEIVIELRPTGVLPIRQTVGTGRVTVVLKSSEARPVDIAIERRTIGGQVLTAGRVRELVGLPMATALSGARGAERRGLVAVERTGVSQDLLRERLVSVQPLTVQADESRLLASFPDPEAALAAALEFSKGDDLGVAVGAAVVSETDSGTLVGEGLDRLVAAAPFGWPQPAVPVERAASMASVLADRGLRLVPTKATDQALRITERFG